MALEKTRDVPAESAEAAAPTGPKIRWDDTSMKSSYANFCNVASTREEVVLLFGMNQALASRATGDAHLAHGSTYFEPVCGQAAFDATRQCLV